MDESTRLFLDSLDTSDPIPKILAIYNRFRIYDRSPVTIETVEHIYTDVVNTFYTGLHEYLVGHGKRIPIKFTDTGKPCREADSLLEAKGYDETDAEFATYDYGFDIPLACINTINGSKTLYSGGYITKSRVLFIILMLLHEIIHVIEYTDSYITTSEVEHTVFFYIVGFQRFGLLSRLSQIIPRQSELVFDSTDRVEEIRALTHERDLEDGADILNDHSHYEDNNGNEILIGYITYDRFKTGNRISYLETGFVGGYKKRNTNTRRSRHNRRSTRKLRR